MFMARYWYSYINSGDVRNASNYVITFYGFFYGSPAVGSAPGCRTGYTVCSIYATARRINRGQPESNTIYPADLSNNIKQYIAAGLSTGVPEPQYPFNTFKFVYMKYVFGD